MPALLIDTYSLFFRAFYGLPPMNTATGQPTQALYGFSSLLLKLLREEAPSGVAFALDLPGGTFRHADFAGYKGTRTALPSALAQQLDGLQELIRAFGFPAFGARGFEADDVIASLARELAASGESVLIASGDRDLLQLVRANVEVLFLGQRGKPAARYDRARVIERFKLPPERLPGYVALLGDPSDNIPKVKGIGPVAAQKLIATYEDIASLLGRLSEIPDARLRATLAEHAEQIRQSERLVRLRDDLELAPGPRTAPLDRTGGERLRALFTSLEFKSLLPRLEALLSSLES